MKILLAEDEKELSRAVTAILAHEGYEVDAVYDGSDAVRKASENVYECMILDIMMPVKDGITALKEIRAAGDRTPVIMLTAKAGIDDRIEGLDSGADDYLTKPFAMKELLARIRSAARRAGSYSQGIVTVGSVTLNLEELELRCLNSVRLARKEALLMELLMRNQGKKQSTETIFERVWKDEADQGPEVVWVYISYLRQKLLSIGADLEIDGERAGAFSLRVVEKS